MSISQTDWINSVVPVVDESNTLSVDAYIDSGVNPTSIAVPVEGCQEAVVPLDINTVLLVPIPKAEGTPFESPNQMLPSGRLGKSLVLPIAVICNVP